MKRSLQSFYAKNFDFLDQIFPKTLFPIQSRENEHHH